MTALCLASLGILQAQQTDSSENPVLRTFDDSVSYCVGISVANFYKQQGVKELNTALVSKAVNDILSGKASLIGDNEANNILNNFFSRLQAEKSKSTIEAGEKFLAANKMRPEVKVTESGLQYEVIKEGTGIKPLATDTFVCNYRGTFVDGKQFDASYDRGEPLILPVTSVIKGWTEGLQLMPVGSRYKFYIPYQLGYGAYDYGSIPGGSALIFDVELLDVKKKNP